MADELLRAALIGVLHMLECDAELAGRWRRFLSAPPPQSEWVSLRDAGVSVRTLRKAIKTGELQAHRIGRELRVRRGDLNVWLASQPVARAPKVSVDAPRDAFRAALENGRLRVVKGTR